jgi:hypothetical protein
MTTTMKKKKRTEGLESVQFCSAVKLVGLCFCKRTKHKQKNLGTSTHAPWSASPMEHDEDTLHALLWSHEPAFAGAEADASLPWAPAGLPGQALDPDLDGNGKCPPSGLVAANAPAGQTNTRALHMRGGNGPTRAARRW